MSHDGLDQGDMSDYDSDMRARRKIRLSLKSESKSEQECLFGIFSNLMVYCFTSDPFFISQNGTFESHEKKLILNQGKRKTGKSPILEIRQNKGLG